jgi:uncharacterized tellurite resistance protein B-like protein
MATKEKLYEAFGELLYAVSKADGTVQPEEKKTVEGILKSHPFGSDILWSFNYEANKTHSFKEAYSKAMDIFKEHGPFEEYGKFAEILTEVAKAFEGISSEESVLIQNFKNDLTKTFLNDENIR